MTPTVYGFYVFFVVTGALASVAFPIMYTIWVSWWRDEFGRFLFVYSALFVLLYSRSVVSLFSSTAQFNLSNQPAGAVAFYMFIVIIADVVMWWLVWLFVKSQRKRRKEVGNASS